MYLALCRGRPTGRTRRLVWKHDYARSAAGSTRPLFTLLTNIWGVRTGFVARRPDYLLPLACRRASRAASSNLTSGLLSADGRRRLRLGWRAQPAAAAIFRRRRYRLCSARQNACGRPVLRFASALDGCARHPPRPWNSAARPHGAAQEKDNGDDRHIQAARFRLSRTDQDSDARSRSRVQALPEGA